MIDIPGSESPLYIDLIDSPIKDTELLTKDGEWFTYRIKAIGPHIQFWINDKLVMTYDDSDYKTGHFAIQGHNPGMRVEAKDLYYRSLDKK